MLVQVARAVRAGDTISYMGTAEVGERVWSVPHGWGTVVEPLPDETALIAETYGWDREAGLFVGGCVVRGDGEAAELTLGGQTVVAEGLMRRCFGFHELAREEIT